MANIEIDVSICKSCGMCAKICPMEVLSQKSKGHPVEVVRNELCIACGQCLAICRQKAHQHSEIDRDRIVLIEKNIVPDYDAVMELIKSRRSVRVFKEKSVDNQLIKLVIDAARFAPSAENSQSTKYVVLQDNVAISKVIESAIKILEAENDKKRKAYKGQEIDWVTEKAIQNIDVILNAFEEGKDRLSFGAPAMIFFYSRIGISYSSENTNLAIQNSMLVAHSLGLGSFYPGYIVTCSKANNAIHEILGIPEGYAVYGALAIGYPKYKMNNYIERNEADIMWV